MEWGLEHISSRELTEWLCYTRLEPWGPEREDLRAAIIACTVANANRDPKRRHKPFTPADFMPKLGEVEAEPDADRLLRQVQRLNAAMGGKDLRVK